MIFSLWPRLAVKLGDERHVFDRATLMFTEVAEIERVTELSYAEWERQLARYSLPAIGALLHVLRRRDGMPSDFKTMEFAAADLEVVPLHEDDTEYTAEEATAELTRRIAGKQEGNGAGPTRAANGQEAPSGDPGSARRKTSTPRSSRSGITSVPGSGTASPTGTSSGSSGTQISA